MEPGTTDALDAVDGAWRFGGGGGSRQNYQLSGKADLLVHGAPGLHHRAESRGTTNSGRHHHSARRAPQTKDQGHSVTLGNDGRIHYSNVREGEHGISHVSGTGTVGLKFTDDIEKNVLKTDGASTVAVHLLAAWCDAQPGVAHPQPDTGKTGTRIRMGQEISAVNGASLTAA